jgi:precorrin-6A/cobalt-precorrin-6A reductase
MPNKVLLLGGTREARVLASLLVRKGFDVTTSLAGVTVNPVLSEGDVRLGGFGGVDGLLRYIHETGTDAIIDATHPFAAQISRHACDAAGKAGLCYLRLERPAWAPAAEDRWISVNSLPAAADALPHSAHVLVTTGRKGLEAFFARDDLTGIIRTIEPPPITLKTGWTLVRDRPPFALEAEIELMRENDITHLVTKNSGGSLTEAKLMAARELKLPVIMVARPPKPDAEICATAEEICTALERRFGP